MKRGYYKLQRGWMNHPIFTKREKYSEREAWLCFIESSSFAKHHVEISGKRLAVDVGSFFTTRSYMCEKFRWSEHQYRSFINRLVKEDMIVTDTTQGFTKVTLCNYEKYQSQSPTNHPYNNKGNNKLSKDADYQSFRSRLIENYPKRRTQLDVANTFRKLQSKIGKKTFCKKHIITEDLFLNACLEYKKECAKNNTDPQYVKCPKTFVNGAFENYISVQVEDNELGRTWKAF